jgi:hypothetical protein
MSDNSRKSFLNFKSVGLLVASAAVVGSAVFVAHEGSPAGGTVTVAKNSYFATNQPYTTPSADVRAGGADTNATPAAGSGG